MKQPAYTFQVRLADKTFTLGVQHIQTMNYCTGYMIPPETVTDFQIPVTEEDIIAEWRAQLSNPRYTPDFVNRLPGYYFEIFALHKKVAKVLLPHDIIVFHSSCIAVDRAGYLFSGSTGDGKSTQAALWCRYFKDRAFPVNDDKPFLKLTRDGVTAFGSPWDGKSRKSTSTSVPLRAVCFLRKAEHTRITPMSPEDAYEKMRMQLLPPENELQYQALERILRAITARVPACTMEASLLPGEIPGALVAINALPLP